MTTNPWPTGSVPDICPGPPEITTLRRRVGGLTCYGVTDRYSHCTRGSGGTQRRWDLDGWSWGFIFCWVCVRSRTIESSVTWRWPNSGRTHYSSPIQPPVWPPTPDRHPCDGLSPGVRGTTGGPSGFLRHSPVVLGPRAFSRGIRREVPTTRLFDGVVDPYFRTSAVHRRRCPWVRGPHRHCPFERLIHKRTLLEPSTRWEVVGRGPTPVQSRYSGHRFVYQGSFSSDVVKR